MTSWGIGTVRAGQILPLLPALYVIVVLFGGPALVGLTVAPEVARYVLAVARHGPQPPRGRDPEAGGAEPRRGVPVSP